MPEEKAQGSSGGSDGTKARPRKAGNQRGATEGKAQGQGQTEECLRERKGVQSKRVELTGSPRPGPTQAKATRRRWLCLPAPLPVWEKLAAFTFSHCIDRYAQERSVSQM